MAATLSPDMGWRPHATKITILVTDAPCHGIGEYGDGFREYVVLMDRCLPLLMQVRAVATQMVNSSLHIVEEAPLMNP